MEKNNNLDINSSPNLLDKDFDETGIKKLNKGPIIFISIALIVVLMGLFFRILGRIGFG